ncbi:MAG: DUF58 domain-containing protein [Proteobacteria bacterium]|nr:DUF58 domain-containing protein [Pseudomonadota bacterium]
MTQLEVSKEFTLSSLEPDWNEDIIDMRFKTSMRTQGSLRMTLMKPSRNPESSRPYVSGDPIHLIDWKAYARTDQVTLRQHRDEASQHVEILIDLRGSMKWPDFDGDRPISKSDLAIRIGLWVAHTHIKYGDTVVCQLIIDDGTQKLN